MGSTKRVKLRCWALAGAIAVAIAAPAWAQETRRFDIPRQDLATALEAFGKQSGKEILFDRTQTQGKAAPAVDCDCVPAEALRRLLTGSGLIYRMANPDTYLVEPSSPFGVAAGDNSEAATYDFDIPSQDLGNALKAFAKASEQEVMYDKALVRGKVSLLLQGTYTADAGIGELLQRTGLAARRDSQGALLVEEASELPNASRADESVTTLDEIVVTGTYIRGANPVAPVRSYGREEIEQSGYTNAGEFIQSLPLNFKGGGTSSGGGNTEDGALSIGVNNVESATSANLRGLGSAATLVLLNGHRVASSAYGTGVDLSLFPLEAIERIEVLPDGATAIYGADAVAGVINIILRREYEGAETFVQVGGADGGRTEFRASQTFGTSWSSGGILGTLNFEHLTALDANARSFTQAIPDSSDLLPQREAISGFVSAHQRLTDTLKITAEVLYRDSDESRDSKLAAGGQQNKYDIDSDFIATHAGLEWDFSSNWRLSIDGNYSRVNTLLRSYYDPPQAGYVNGEPNLRNRFDEYSAEAKVDGALFELPAGTVRLALGASHRSEDFSSLIVFNGTDRPSKRSVDALFSELLIPIVGSDNAIPLIDRLTLSVAGRVDSYSAFGTTRNPRIGVLWAPTSQLTLRGSYSTSFRAPTPLQVIGNRTTQIFIFPGYALPSGGTGKVLLVPNLDPLGAEDAESLNFSATYEPGFLPNLKLQVGAYRIEFENAIVRAPSNPDILVRPDIYGALPTSFVDDASVENYVAQLVAQGYSVLDASGGGGNLAGIRFSIPTLNINASRVLTQGIDLSASYSFSLGTGRAYINADASIIDKFETGFCSGCMSTDLLNTTENPVSFRSRIGSGWANPNLQFNAAINYTDDYANIRPVVPERVGSFTTVDANLIYTPSFLSGTTMGLSVTNVFDEKPPFVSLSPLPGMNYDPANASPLGRFVAFHVRKVW